MPATNKQHISDEIHNLPDLYHLHFYYTKEKKPDPIASLSFFLRKKTRERLIHQFSSRLQRSGTRRGVGQPSTCYSPFVFVFPRREGFQLLLAIFLPNGTGKELSP